MRELSKVESHLVAGSAFNVFVDVYPFYDPYYYEPYYDTYYYPYPVTGYSVIEPCTVEILNPWGRVVGLEYTYCENFYYY